jgi:crossover junction endodeoxyribonuclease RuvC
LTTTRILGVDPGTIATGWGVIESDGHRNQLLEFGVVRTAAKAPLPQRLLTVFDGLRDVMERFRPDAMAVEEVFLGKNPRSAFWVSHARAVAMLLAAQHGLSLAEYAAREVKLSMVGNGAASKKQVEFMVGTILEVDGPIPSDAADALAVALCHAFRCPEHPKLAQP